MTIQQAKDRITYLTRKLNEYSHSYYNLSISLITDFEYDKLLSELENLEQMYPELKFKNSPTSNVGYLPASKFLKEKHEYPMLSIQNSLSIDELKDFFKRIQKELTNIDINNLEFMMEPKIDGVSISLIYENGILISAITRGDGEVGELVTNNIKNIVSIPWTINYPNKVTIRGEIFSTISNFNNINSLLDEKSKFSNPRNFSSGTIRILDPKIVKSRNLSALFYQVIEDEGIIKSQEDTFQFLKDNKFPYFEDYKISRGIENVLKNIDYFDKLRKKIDFEIDGIVIKVNQHTYYNELGRTSKFPKWLTAFKFPPKIVRTKLIDIFPTVGRTGIIIYNAKLEPVELQGSIITFATLHNLEYIKKLDLRIGDIVEIKKSGEIIPKVIGPVIELRSSKRPLNIWTELEFCPTCNEKLVFSNTKNDQYCKNENCSSRIINKLIHFASKDALDFYGLGEKTIELFYNNGLLKSINDFYLLKDKKNVILEMEGFQERSAKKILDSIETSKKKSLERVLYGFGIEQIGLRSAIDISQKFKNIDNIINLTQDDLENINDFGFVKASSLINFFQKNLQTIEFLKKMGVNFSFIEDEEINANVESKFYKKIVVVTGTFDDLKRSEAEKKLSSLGAIVRKSPNSKTDFLICGDKPSQNKISSVEESKIINTNSFNDIF